MNPYPKRILVTGGAGFIGCHLVRKLLARQNEVIVLDNFFTGSRSNLFNMPNSKFLSIIEADITDPINIHVDQIYNLACPASPIHYQKNPRLTIETNVIGMTNMLKLACRTGAKVLQASTSEVYGDPLEHPQAESYLGNVNPIGPRACYDEGKRVAETLCIAYHEQNNVPIRIARIFNTYGPYMHPDDGRVVSNFVLQALRGQDITLYGDGRQTRSFCFVDDLVDGLIRLMETDYFPGPVNLGNPTEFTIRELADLIIEMTGSRSKVIYVPLPKDDPKKRKPFIKRAMDQLDWYPNVNLRDGLVPTIHWFREFLEKDQNRHPPKISGRSLEILGDVNARG